MKGITKVNQEFFNEHFIKPDEDGKYRPMGLFYYWGYSQFWSKPTYIVINNRDGNPQVMECIDRKEAESWLEEWMNEVEDENIKP